MHLHQSNENDDNNRNLNNNHAAESDETKLARQRIRHMKQLSQDMDVIMDITDFPSTKYSSDPKSGTMQSDSLALKSGSNLNCSELVQVSSAVLVDQRKKCESNDSDSLKAEIEISTINSKKQPHRQKGHSKLDKTTNIFSSSDTAHSSLDADGHQKSKIGGRQQIPWSNLVVPLRKPISCVAPTNITQSASVRILAVAPNINKGITNLTNGNDKQIPALPPKPNRNTEIDTTSQQSNGSVPSTGTAAVKNNSKSMSDNDRQRIPTIGLMPTLLSVINKVASNETTVDRQPAFQHSTHQLNVDNLPIKAKPLTIRKQPMSEQPRLRSMPSNIKNMQYGSRRIEMPPAFLFPEIEEVPLKSNDGKFPSTTDAKQLSQRERRNSSSDDTDKSTESSGSGDEKMSNAILTHNDVKRRPRSSLSDNNKVKLIRRVSFDPLALLLDASLEGELELVKKTAIQVKQQMRYLQCVLNRIKTNKIYSSNTSAVYLFSSRLGKTCTKKLITGLLFSNIRKKKTNFQFFLCMFFRALLIIIIVGLIHNIYYCAFSRRAF